MYVFLDIEWAYGDKSGVCHTDFGYPDYTKDMAQKDIKNNDWYWWTEGNGACDCNRSTAFGLSEEGFECGDTIKIFKITPVGISEKRRDKKKEKA